MKYIISLLCAIAIAIIICEIYLLLKIEPNEWLILIGWIACMVFYEVKKYLDSKF